MPENNLERQLVENFLKLKNQYEKLSLQAGEKKKEFEIAEAELLDYLDDQGAEKTATYEGLGHATRMPDIVNTAYLLDEPDAQEKLFAYLRSPGVDRADIIKTAVHSASLKSFVSQELKDKHLLPPGVGYILKASLRAYPYKPKIKE